MWKTWTRGPCNITAPTRSRSAVTLAQPRLPGKPEGDAIYFDAFGFLLVRYPAWLAWPLTLSVLMLLIGVMRLGFRGKELTGRGIGKSALLFFLSLIAAGAAVWGAWWLVRLIHPGYSLIPHGDSYSHGLYVLGFSALALATAAAILGGMGRRISGPNLFVGALLWWAASLAAATL